MWKQKRIGYYTKGNDVMTIEVNGHDAYLAFVNEMYIGDYQSLQELDDYLRSVDATPLSMMYPKRVQSSSEWQWYGPNQHYEEFYSRKLDNGEIQSIVVSENSIDEMYTVMMRRRDYSCEACLVETCLEFSRELKRNPLTDIELDVYEVGTHGSSGMEKVHYELKDYEEVQTVLKNEYRIDEKVKRSNMIPRKT